VSKQRKPPPTSPPRGWAPLKAAFAQVAVSVGWDNLAAHDLTQDLRKGLLFSMCRSFDGSVTRLLRPSDWRQWRVQPPYFMLNFDFSDRLPREHGVEVTPVDENAPPFVAGHIFVRRRELDERYPATTPSERRADDKQPTPPLRSKPGPRTRTPTPETAEAWPLHIARELIRRTLAGRKWPTGSSMLQFCENNWDWQPDIRQMQKLLKFLRG
jgi:hypothetical protein